MNDDADLLRRYARDGSQEAFAELVNRRIGMVYAAALRQTGGDAHRAQDVSQAVFTGLARKAESLSRHPALIGWLYTSVRFAARKMARTEWRRRHREEVAFSLAHELAPEPPEVLSEELRPILDEAMHQLPETDRQALLLRFFDGRSMAELGLALGLSAAAAQKRVDRAMARLRTILARRGLASTSAALAVALGHEAAAATVPVGLAASISGTAVAAAAVGAGAGIASFLTAPMSIAAGISATVLAAAVGVASYESHPSARRGTGMSANAPANAVEIRTISLPEDGDAPSVSSHVPTNGVIGPVRLPPPAPPKDTHDISVPAPHFQPPSAMDLAPTAPSYDLSQLDQQPVPVLQVRPRYPQELREQNLSGQVVVDFTVDPAGQVTGATAVQSTQPGFERAAVDAVSAWKFQPGVKDGRAVSTHMQLPIVFTANPDE